MKKAFYHFMIVLIFAVAFDSTWTLVANHLLTIHASPSSAHSIAARNVRLSDIKKPTCDDDNGTLPCILLLTDVNKYCVGQKNSAGTPYGGGDMPVKVDNPSHFDADQIYCRTTTEPENQFSDTIPCTNETPADTPCNDQIKLSGSGLTLDAVCKSAGAKNAKAVKQSDNSVRCDKK
jgi:hypothetical protein